MGYQHVRYLLIGNGVAASSAAAAIRGRDNEGSVMLITQDIHRPYNRPPLSKEFLRHQTSRDALFTHSGEWFERQHISLRTGLRVARIDADRQSVALENGDEVGFDRLLLAVRAQARPLDVPGSQLPGLFTLRSIEDAIGLQTAVEKARREGQPHEPKDAVAPAKRGRVAVIGGGLLGVETAASLSQLGMQVHLILSKPFPWPRFAGDAVGKVIATQLENHGIILHPANRAAGLEGDGRVQRIRLADGQAISCDFAVAAVGSAVNKSLLRGTSISAENAILTDEYCRTSVSTIFAAGDCAAIFDPLFGKHRAIDQWEHGAVTGALAGRNLAGANEPYHGVNSLSSEVFGLPLRAWGEAKLVDRRLVRAAAAPGQSAMPDLVEFGVAADDRICQAVAIGASADAKILEEFVARRFVVDGNAEQFKDPAVPLEQLLG
ncbi:MAG TPA: FAD-dependent oxidoreductase [Tepidisphaeraceae bacterium]|nr:FAD-dependent oxidoreductase [Tepidisphaeraceae bacterium]